ncbi:MAG: carboxy terminal-processing peptidase [Niabella sp.]
MKRLPFVALFLVLAISFFVFKSSMATNSNPPGKYEQIIRMVGQMLAYVHFSPKNIDDDFSRTVLTKYINDLDAEKNIFLKPDVNLLMIEYGDHIDNELKGDSVKTFVAVSDIFTKRITESALWSKDILSHPFDYTIKEDIQLDGKKIDFVINEQERKDRWRKKLKYITLQRFAELLDERTANKGTKGYVVKSDAQLEKDARAKTDTLMNRYFNRYKAKFTEEDNFNLFVNAITNAMDPHTEFMPPIDKRYFDEEMSGVFYGIGAGLQYTDEGIKITSINPGSPSAKSNMLAPGDIIIKVGQGDEAPVDLLGFGVQDAVKLIRGKEGTVVVLTVKKPDATIKTVKLVRARIEIVETFARSAIITDPVKKTKIGVIYLPEFYADFDDPNGRRSYLDVAKEVEKLKAEKVSGIIMDLRWNGGGSLMDVVQMVGLFIDNGPVVQVKDRNNRPQILSDRNDGVKYDGPLAVMVNEFSASASEIFAAAIQDYGRGVVIGSTSTFGKGTVQRQVGLDANNGFTPNDSELGTVKLTLQKFYRISGGSTQLKGVESDIVLPTQIEALKFREKDNEFALPYDEIPKAFYNPWHDAYVIKEVQQLSDARLTKDTIFKIIKSNSEWLSSEENKSSSLNIDDYRKERKLIKAKSDQVNAVLKLKNKLSVALLPKEKDQFKNDTAKKERSDQWLKGMSEDIYLDQAVRVVEDMIGLEAVAKTNAAAKN